MIVQLIRTVAKTPTLYMDAELAATPVPAGSVAFHATTKTAAVVAIGAVSELSGEKYARRAQIVESQLKLRRLAGMTGTEKSRINVIRDEFTSALIAAASVGATVDQVLAVANGFRDVDGNLPTMPGYKGPDKAAQAARAARIAAAPVA